MKADRTATTPEGDRRWGPYGLYPALILVSVNFLDGMEANFIPGVLSLLQDEWGFGDLAAGAIPTAMAIAGLVITLPAGYLADRVDRRRLLALVVGSWSVLTMASGLATSFWMFFLVRVLLGTAAHIDNPCSSSLVTDFYPTEWRARVFALQRAAWYIGIAIGVALGGVLGDAFGWRAPFFVMTAPGLVVAWLVFRLQEPVRAVERPPVSVAPDPGTTDRRRRDELIDDIRLVLRVPSLRRIFVGVAVAFGGFNGLGYWLPSFWERRYDLSEGTSATLTGVLALVGTLAGSSLGGSLGDRWLGRGATGRVELAMRMLVAGGGLLVIGLVIVPLGIQIPVLVAAAVCIVAAMPSFAAVVADVLPAHCRGIGFAVFTFLVSMSTALGPLVIGLISEVTGSLRTALVLCAVPCIPGALVLGGARRTIAADMDAAKP